MGRENRWPPLRAVTFDITGTLLRPRGLGRVYEEVLGRHGIDLAAETADRLFSVVWQEMACRTDAARDRFASHPRGPRGWWRRFVERLAELAELPRPSPFACSELFDRFGQPDAWELYDDAVPCLDRLAEMGLTLGVISNWDGRLHGLLEGLGLADRFAAVICSSEVGYEKPDARIFTAALEALGLEPEEVAHVGDGRREDWEGALGAHLDAYHLVRSARSQWAGEADLETLEELPRILGGAVLLTSGR